MIRKLIILTILIIFLSLLPDCSNKHLNIHESSQALPKAPREFRAAWVATVANINWPSAICLSVEEQKNETIKILDLLKENNLTEKDIRDAVGNLNTIAVSSIDKFGNESTVIEYSIPNLDYKNLPTFDDVLKLYNQKKMNHKN